VDKFQDLRASLKLYPRFEVNTLILMLGGKGFSSSLKGAYKAGYEGLLYMSSNREMGVPNTSEEIFPDVATSHNALILSACLSLGLSN
jgi:hypothetical protein